MGFIVVKPGERNGPNNNAQPNPTQRRAGMEAATSRAGSSREQVQVTGTGTHREMGS